MRYPPLVSVDLSPPQALREGVSLLLEIIETYDSMMVSMSGKKPAFEPVISALLDPIIQVRHVNKLVPFRLIPSSITFTFALLIFTTLCTRVAVFALIVIASDRS